MESNQLKKVVKRDMPEGLWTKCPGCGKTIFTRSMQENSYICQECGHHFRVPARKRVLQICDEGTFEEMLADMISVDPLNFVDSKSYKDRAAGMRKTTGLNEAAIIGKGFIKGRPAVLGVLDPDFMMGSMGSVVGEKITKAIEYATEHNLPMITITCSGGARMQEGALSLMQMAKTSAAVAKLHDKGGLYISVLADPTTGGVTASFAMLADIIISEPKALICFAGPRTIWQTIKVKLPEGFQRAEFLMEHGFVDTIVNRKDLRTELARLIDYCGK